MRARRPRPTQAGQSNPSPAGAQAVRALAAHENDGLRGHREYAKLQRRLLSVRGQIDCGEPSSMRLGIGETPPWRHERPARKKTGLKELA